VILCNASLQPLIVGPSIKSTSDKGLRKRQGQTHTHRHRDKDNDNGLAID